jgi:hypothetical protein
MSLQKARRELLHKLTKAQGMLAEVKEALYPMESEGLCGLLPGRVCISVALDNMDQALAELSQWHLEVTRFRDK